MANLVMVYDTETSGLPDFKAGFDADTQPNLVQLGYKVFDPATRETIFEVGHLVNSAYMVSWKGIDPGAQAVHGITEESIIKYGTLPEDTMKYFLTWMSMCNLCVAHNDAFDTRIMMCFASRLGMNPGIFDGKTKFCTMQRTTSICRIPNPNGRGGYKWPKLDEAYRQLINPQGFGNAHNALADVNACADIFWYLVDSRLVELPNV